MGRTNRRRSLRIRCSAGGWGISSKAPAVNTAGDWWKTGAAQLVAVSAANGFWILPRKREKQRSCRMLNLSMDPTTIFAGIQSVFNGRAYCTYTCTSIPIHSVRLSVCFKAYNTFLVAAGIEPWRPARKAFQKPRPPAPFALSRPGAVPLRSTARRPHVGEALRF